MANVAWEISHAVETCASAAFAWKYWSNVSNWDDPPAAFELQGPFRAGSCGISRIPGHESRLKAKMPRLIAPDWHRHFAANLPYRMAKIARAMTEAYAHYTDEPS